MRTAIIHYWIVADRGGEKVVRALCEMFPDAVIFTHVADPSLAKALFPGHEIRTTFISKLPFSRRLYQTYLPFMPLALEELDLSGFDLVISSESGPAKGVIPPPAAPHLCYCHSPMRYLWDQYRLYRDNAGFPARLAFPGIAHRLRQWDVTSAARVDEFIANSAFVASRIDKYYRRPATVIHPPVEIEAYSSLARSEKPELKDAYLWVGQLTAYKNPALAVRVFSKLKKKLVVIGDGQELRALRAMAGDTVAFLGRGNAQALRDAYASCRALIFPGEEDFGMVPVEAMAAGMPVIALNAGGATETVADMETGVLFDRPTEESLSAAIEKFERCEKDFDPQTLRRRAKQFDKTAFKTAMGDLFHKYGVDTNRNPVES